MNKKVAIVVVVAGVLFNNYVYLHDLVTNKHEGLIHVGPTSGVGIAIAVGAIVVGLVTLGRQRV